MTDPTTRDGSPACICNWSVGCGPDINCPVHGRPDLQRKPTSPAPPTREAPLDFEKALEEFRRAIADDGATNEDVLAAHAEVLRLYAVDAAPARLSEAEAKQVKLAKELAAMGGIGGVPFAIDIAPLLAIIDRLAPPDAGRTT